MYKALLGDECLVVTKVVEDDLKRSELKRILHGYTLDLLSVVGSRKFVLQKQCIMNFIHGGSSV